jgi:glycosyltransferase involved in cell wall biosynthesis
MDTRIRYHQLLVSPRIGGAENLAIALHRHAIGVEPGSSELLVPMGSETRRFVEAEGLGCRTYDLDAALGRNTIAALRSNLSLYLKLLGSGPGVLHIHSPYVFAALRPLRAVSRLRTILHLHLDYTEELLRWPLRLNPDLVIVCAKFMKGRVEHALAAIGSRRANVMVAVNAVDTQRFAPGDQVRAKRELGVDAERPVLLMTANLAPHKGQETAIRAVSMLVDRGYRPLLWLVGEERDGGDEYARRLHALVETLNLSAYVEFLGFRTDVPTLLHAADCLMLPSTQEGLPLAVLEAQASKVVVLAAPTAGIPEVVEDGSTGFLIESDNPAGYANVLTALIRNPDQGRAVAEAAYRRVVGSLSLNRYCESIHAQHASLLEPR